MKWTNFSLMLCLGLSLIACGGNGNGNNNNNNQNPTPPPATPTATPVPTPVATPTADPVLCDAGQVLDEATNTCVDEVVVPQWTDYSDPECISVAGRGYSCQQCRKSLPLNEESVTECKEYGLSKAMKDLISGINNPKFGQLVYVNMDGSIKVSVRDLHDNEIGKAVLVEFAQLQLGHAPIDKNIIYYRYAAATKRLELFDYKRNKVFSKDGIVMVKVGSRSSR